VLRYIAKVHSDTAPVRPGEEINPAVLAEYLQGRLGAAGDGIRIAQFPNGHSNLVYLVEIAGREYVLRRPPLGPVAAKAHDMAREYRVLHAVYPHFPEAPAVYLVCEDAAVIGAPFFLMERRSGLVIRETVPAELAAIADYPARISEAFIDCLVRLHAIDVTQPDLLALGKPDGFVARQVKGWSERWARARTHELPAMERVIEWLQNRLPPSLAATLVHNDYKLDNVMLRPSGDAVAAVLDWEMTTIGDPLADLGLILCYWSWAGRAAAGVIPAVTTQPGWYTRDQFLHRYAQKTSRDLTHIGYHEVLGVFKLAVILQQIFYRFHVGQTQDERFRHFDRQVKALVELAAELVERAA
jgi:aminoglycoside phosphotransferase (APT) family kinase protein